VTDQRVQIVASDPAWGERFAAQKAAVEAVLHGVLAEPVHHIGSTSVPGLPAKPVIDMLALVRSLKDATERVPELSANGWLFWPDDPNRDYRLWFLRPTPEARTHHLHILELGHPQALAILTFRDALRADENLRLRYSALKAELAERFPDDRNAYTNAKGSFVDQVLRDEGIEPPQRREL
jgi:GrpB-like predicted nucleotidyltransferase (UPF0157 family)